MVTLLLSVVKGMSRDRLAGGNANTGDVLRNNDLIKLKKSKFSD